MVCGFGSSPLNVVTPLLFNFVHSVIGVEVGVEMGGWEVVEGGDVLKVR